MTENEIGLSNLGELFSGRMIWKWNEEQEEQRPIQAGSSREVNVGRSFGSFSDKWGSSRAVHRQNYFKRKPEQHEVFFIRGEHNFKTFSSRENLYSLQTTQCNSKLQYDLLWSERSFLFYCHLKHLLG